MTRVLLTKTAEETERIGHELGKSLQPPMVFALRGPLGAGKTTFVRGLARGLGIDRVKSPSFTFINLYEGRVPLYHVDLYRLEAGEELVPLGLLEIFADEQAAAAVEWAERCESLLPEARLEVRFEHLSQGERRLSLEAMGEDAIRLLSSLHL
jgi:tRNA threonylcarbamoyladenosine biosynthesis protein TsaE